MNWSWGTRIVIVYVAFVLSTLGFVAFAMSQRVDLVSSDYYEQAIHHDKHQTARRNAALAHARIIVAKDTMVLTGVEITELSDLPELQLQRPQDPQMDVRGKMRIDEHGDAFYPMHTVARGLWNVRLQWQQSGARFQIDTSLSL